MNTQVFVAVLAALVVYRTLSPLIDAVNPLSFLNKSKGRDAMRGSAAGSGIGAGRG